MEIDDWLCVVWKCRPRRCNCVKVIGNALMFERHRFMVCQVTEKVHLSRIEVVMIHGGSDRSCATSFDPPFVENRLYVPGLSPELCIDCSADLFG